MAKQRSGLKRLLPAVLGSTFVGVVAIVVVVLIQDMMDAPPPNKKSVQQITLLQPPPPPPPPPKVEPPPEPEIEEVKAAEPEPEPVPDAADEPPPGADLALDADGMGAGDAFGLLGKKGGRALIGTGGGSVYAWYAARIQDDIQEVLNGREDIRKQRYSVKVNLWVDADGSVRKVEILSSSGNKDVDKSLRAALKEITQLTTRPPEELPQPVRLRIASRI